MTCQLCINTGFVGDEAIRKVGNWLHLTPPRCPNGCDPFKHITAEDMKKIIDFVCSQDPLGKVMRGESDG
jgi:hypothetical protein